MSSDPVRSFVRRSRDVSPFSGELVDVEEVVSTPDGCQLLTDSQVAYLIAALEGATALLDALDGAVAYIRRVGGYMAPEQQHELMRWQQLLSDHGRTGTAPGVRSTR